MEIDRAYPEEKQRVYVKQVLECDAQAWKSWDDTYEIYGPATDLVTGSSGRMNISDGQDTVKLLVETLTSSGN